MHYLCFLYSSFQENCVFRDLQSYYMVESYVYLLCLLCIHCFLYLWIHISPLLWKILSHIFFIVSLPSCMFFPCVIPNQLVLGLLILPSILLNCLPYISISLFVCALLYETNLFQLFFFSFLKVPFGSFFRDRWQSWLPIFAC